MNMVGNCVLRLVYLVSFSYQCTFILVIFIVADSIYRNWLL